MACVSYRRSITEARLTALIAQNQTNTSAFGKTSLKKAIEIVREDLGFMRLKDTILRTFPKNLLANVLVQHS